MTRLPDWERVPCEAVLPFLVAMGGWSVVAGMALAWVVYGRRRLEAERVRGWRQGMVGAFGRIVCDGEDVGARPMFLDGPVRLLLAPPVTTLVPYRAQRSERIVEARVGTVEAHYAACQEARVREWALITAGSVLVAVAGGVLWP